MRNIICAFVLGLGLVFPTFTTPLYAFGNYMSPDKAMRDVKKMRRNGMYPASMTCNQDKSKKFLKPDIAINWKKNVNGIEWELMAYKGQLQIRPGFHEKNRWHEVYKKKIVLGGASFWCLIYHRR